jgi:N-acyl homoserine lactone hydrolase
MNEQIQSGSKVSYRQIIEGLSLRPKIGFFGYSSVTLIQDGDQNILFDTGGYGVRSTLQAMLKEITVHKVFLSHLHLDHCANVSLFKDAEIYVNQAELDSLYKNRDSIYSDFNDFTIAALEKLRVVAFSDEQQITENTKVLSTPGHTLGHSSLEILSQDKRTAVAGDAIETYQEYLNDNYQADFFDEQSYLLSKKLLKDSFPVIIPGHASIIEDGFLRDSALSLKSF